MSKSFPSWQRIVTDLRLINLFLALTWLLVFRYCLQFAYYDPSSFFFRHEDAYKPMYSAIREHEADAFLSDIQSWSEASGTSYGSKGRATGGKSNYRAPYCIGVPSLQREQNEFLPRAVASLVDGLEPKERELLYIVILLSDDDATNNSAFGQHWLNTIADMILVHEDTPDSMIRGNQYHRIPRLPETASRDERVRRDYAMLSETCRKRNAEYFILIEDDVIAARDWLPRLRAALPKVSARTLAKGSDWLYLRLFYSETYMGWNSEEWPMYIRNIMVVYLVASGCIIAIRQLPIKTSLISKERRLKLSKWLPLNLLAVWLPLFIFLAFISGRMTVSPLRRGVQEMPMYGCCSQGLVIPNRHLNLLEHKLGKPPFDLPADSTIEKAANDEGLEKWAMVPSVLQHIGVRGSSAQGGHKKNTWNFSFEREYLKVP